MEIQVSGSQPVLASEDELHAIQLLSSHLPDADRVVEFLPLEINDPYLVFSDRNFDPVSKVLRGGWSGRSGTMVSMPLSKLFSMVTCIRRPSFGEKSEVFLDCPCMMENHVSLLALREQLLQRRAPEQTFIFYTKRDFPPSYHDPLV